MLLACVLLEALGRRNKAFYNNTADCRLFARMCSNVKAIKLHGREYLVQLLLITKTILT